MMFTERPYLLSYPNIPKPLHGLNPRTIMGKEQWDELRQEVYASTQYHCAACGVHKANAKRHKWLEAHELFEIDYKKGVAEMKEIVPLCHFCHSFIHSGLLRVRARNRQVTAQHVRDVLNHGCDVLRRDGSPIFVGTVELCGLVGVDCADLLVMRQPKKIAPWGCWRMIWDGVEYRGKFKTQRDWARKYTG